METGNPYRASPAVNPDVSDASVDSGTVVESSTDLEDSAHSSTAWSVSSHVVGLLGVVIGVGSGAVFTSLPTGHPAYGGPDPGRVIQLLSLLVISCAAVAIVIFVQAWQSRHYGRLLYALPPLTFIGFVVILLIRMWR